MPAAPMRPGEAEHLRSLRLLDVLDTPPDAEFDALVRAASIACGVPISLISLIDEHRQWFKANTGLPAITETPRAWAFCGYAVLSEEIIEINDALADPRVLDNPLVTGEPGIRFYAGVRLRVSDGAVVGALCVIDRQPRQLDDQQREILRCLACAASGALESRRLRQQHERDAASLRVSEERLRRLYEATPAMMHSVDELGRLVSVSNLWLQKLGYTREEVIGRSSTDFLIRAPANDARTLSLPRFFHAGSFESLECKMVCKDGAAIDVVLSAIRDDLDDEQRGLAVIEDVTLRRQAERALAAEHHRLTNLIKGSAMGTWEWNLQTGEVHFNERWANLLGFTQADLEPLSEHTWFHSMHPDDVARARSLLDQHLDGKTALYDVEFRALHRDGHIVWLLSSGAIVSRTIDGRPEWLFGTRKDISARKQQEEKLRQSQEFLERTGRAAGVGGWEIDLLTGKLQWTLQTYHIYGLPPEHQPSVESAIQFYAPEARPLIREAVERAISTGECFDLELPFIRADGRAIWVRSVGYATLVEGRTVRLSGAFQDITDRVVQRQELQRANERIQLATNSGGIGIWEWDPVNEKLRWDKSTYRLFGMRPRDVLENYETWAQCLHPDDRAKAEQVGEDALAGIAPYDTEFRVVWEDGSVHHLRAAGSVTRDAQGRALCMVGVNWDVTDSRTLAADLARQMNLQAEASEREAALFQNSANILGILRVDEEAGETVFRYETISPALLQITGWRPEEFIGRRIDHCLPDTAAEQAKKQCKSCVEQGRTISFEATLNTPKGMRQFEGSRTPIRQPTTGEIHRICLEIHDVTERNRLLAAEHHSHKMEAIGRLAAGVAHDFNNILQSISGSLELVQDELPDGSAAYDLAALGLRSANRGSYLTQHLLSYARKQLLRPTLIDLPVLMSDIEKLLARTLGPNIELSLRTDPAAKAVRADGGQIQTALLNLAINASHAMEGGGKILIEIRAVTEDTQNWVFIDVTDNGTGMDSETLARAVEPFFTTKGLNGTGLGLSMVQGFAEQSGGRLQIRSALGCGTTVTICLPAAVPEAAEPLAQRALHKDNTACILLVDDDPDVLVTIGAFLEKAGFTTIRAENATEALALLAKSASISAIVTDYAMPGMNGGDLIAEARVTRAALPALIISGFAEMAENASLGDGIIVLHKPFQRHSLVFALRRLLGWEVDEHISG